MSVYARPDVVKECLSPPTSSSCRCKAWVHRGGTHTGSQVHIYNSSINFFANNFGKRLDHVSKRVRYSELGCKGHVQQAAWPSLFSIELTMHDSRLVLVLVVYSIMIHTFIPEVKLSDVLFDNH